MFDPSAFLDATTTEALTKRPPLPAGLDFVATIGELKSVAWQGKADPTKSGIRIDVPLQIDLNAYPDVKAALGGSIDKVTITDGIMLDLTPAGAIDFAPGRNGKLRRYREALDMNQPGAPFSVRMFQGRLIKVKIKHEPYEGELYEKVDSVAKAG
ncbi:MAG: hypothetical protein SFV24_19020 [Gemmatimonadales bacterium]|nr:hypothetical protein [Gemmatimonadales bacterium]